MDKGGDGDGNPKESSGDDPGETAAELRAGGFGAVALKEAGEEFSFSERREFIFEGKHALPVDGGGG